MRGAKKNFNLLRYLIAKKGFEYDVCIINLEETPKNEHH
jgi:hypothetical protein